MYKIGSKIDEVRIDGNLDALKRDLEYYKKINIEAVELPVHGLDAIKNGLLDKRQVKRVKEILADFDFEYSVHSPNPLNLMNRQNLKLHVSVFMASLEFASEIGSNILVYHSGRFVPEETFPVKGNFKISLDEKRRLLDMEAKSLKMLADEFPDIIICMENARPYLFHSPYCYAEKPDALKKQIEKINRKNVRATLDIGHLYMAAGFYDFDPIEAAAEIKELIAHTHVHDNFGDAVHHYEKQQTHQIPFGRGDSHMPVGWGEIPIEEILSTYIEIYHGMFMMELRSRYFNNVVESRNNLEKILESYSYAGPVFHPKVRLACRAGVS
ncbi:MAG: sugar phosphate isomerase/epimerase [Thermodesulfobacteriota bacterium]|nr:sugar phosphate isomerase/epimerase [Thermodesulfobacteriota bacterium]